MRDDLDYAAIRRRVEIELQLERRRAQIRLFQLHCVVFVLFMFVSGGILTDLQNGGTLWLIIGWILALGIHARTVFATGSQRWMDKRRKRITAREIEYARMGTDDVILESDEVKTKRFSGSRLRLSDEGELLDILDDDNETGLKREQNDAR